MSDAPTPDRPLFKRFPALVSRLPFVPLGELPTPVKPLAALASKIGIEDLWVKCDDISSSVYGGNKIRKLEFLLADAMEQGCTSVLTFGGLGSNHALATSINCKQLGLECIAVLTPEPATAAVYRTLRYHQLLGTRLEIARQYADARAIAAKCIEQRGATKVYEVPFGGSSWVGATGFVNAGLELADQITGQDIPEPDIIYLGCGTAGSAAGLALGLQLAGLKTKIEAIQVTPESIQPTKLFAQLIKETSLHLHALDTSVNLTRLPATAVNIRQDQLGDGYAMPTEAAIEATRLLMQTEHIPASLTYTGKAMAALIADARDRQLEGKRTLFWNTFNSNPYPELPEDESWRALPEGIHHLFSK
jgi:D-cysteine desulfhydrase